MKKALGFIVMSLLLAGCSSGQAASSPSSSAPTPTVSATKAKTTPTAAPTSKPVASTPTARPKPAPTGYAASVPAQFPGYPLIVHGASLDYRVKFAFEGKLVDDQVVAVAPGLYTPYNPHVPDLLSYYDHVGVYGDSAIKRAYMPENGGATWPGVLPGPEEPK